MKANKASLSRGNSKGVGWNISVPPVVTCKPGIPCARDCYAMKSWRMYPNVRASWGHNLDLLKRDPEAFFASVSEQILEKKPRFFRIFVAGDFRNQDDVRGWAQVARENPATRFLVFTKQHGLDYRSMPDNVEVVRSMWPGYGRAGGNVRRAWCQDGTETRVPDDAIECPGNCESCGMCWELAEIGRDVVFQLH